MKSGLSAIARLSVSSRKPEPSIPVADNARISFKMVSDDPIAYPRSIRKLRIPEAVYHCEPSSGPTLLSGIRLAMS